MHSHLPFRLLPACLLALLAACGSDGSTAPTQSRADLNQAFVELGIPALATVSATVAGVPSFTPAIADRSPCAYAAASQSFACPTQTAGGLTIAASYSLRSASGAAQSVFDPATTDAVHTDASAAGTVTNGATRLTVDAKQSLTLSGLLAEHHVLDGTGSSAVDGVLAQGSSTVPVSMTSTTTISKLTFPATGSASKWPLSGTIATETSTTVAGVPPIPARAVVTFDGTSRVAVELTIAGATHRCTIDLASQAPGCG